MTNSITQIIAHFFFLSLAFGTQFFTPVVNTKLTGVGFYKLCTSIVLASLVLAFGVYYSMSSGLNSLEIGLYSVLIVSNILGSFFHKDQKTWPMWVLYVIQVLSF